MGYWVDSQTIVKPTTKRDVGESPMNETVAIRDAAKTLSKRAVSSEQTSQWHLSMSSWDARRSFTEKWTFPGTTIVHNSEENRYYSQWENREERGLGQNVYIMEPAWPSRNEVSILCMSHWWDRYSCPARLGCIRKRQPSGTAFCRMGSAYGRIILR